MNTIIMRASDDDRVWSFFALFQGFRFLGGLPISLVFAEASTGTREQTGDIPPSCQRSTSSPTGTEKERSALWFHDVQHGRCPKAFAQQYISVSDNRHAGHEAFNVSVTQNHLLDVTVRGWCPACRFDERNREDHGRFGGDIPLFDFD